MNKEELKVVALKQKIGELVSNYEETIAEFRADATLAIANLEQQVEYLKEENAQLKHEAFGGSEGPEVVQGEVVQEG